GLEPMGDVIDEISNHMSAMSISVSNLEQAVAQLTHMVVEIGTAVMGLVHMANNQAASSQAEASGSQAGATSSGAEADHPATTTSATEVQQPASGQEVEVPWEVVDEAGSTEI
ncbi:unnamed protein product, partial [Prorocentrum cordatum]